MSEPPSIRLPNAPVLIADHRGAVMLSTDGELEQLDHAEAARRVQATPPILCHAKANARYLKIAPFPAFDVLELFAFVRPATFCLPTVRGVAVALDLAAPASSEDMALGLIECVRRLLGELALPGKDRKNPPEPIARTMAQANWPWGISVLAVLENARAGEEPRRARNPVESLKVWNRLKEWEDSAPPPPPGSEGVNPDEVRGRLADLLGDHSEDRPQQVDYAIAVTHAFAPTDIEGEPRAVVAEAGTGVGKTLGYIAPASLWAEKNQGPVWVSTFTRNLQRQLDGELDRLYPDPAEKALRAVIRKGRENYLCLLNLEDAVQSQAGNITALGLIARWVAASRDGDMVGGDFPAWLVDLLGRRQTLDLTDTRGECIYSACSHYGRCFIEKSVRRARRAHIVVANHALVMIQAALGGDDANRPTRYVFDEGHHLFDAADSAFSAHLTGFEAAELRRWLLGAESRQRSRARGLKARIEDLIVDDEKAAEALSNILSAAHALPNLGWRERLGGGNPHGPTEIFLAAVRQQVYARDGNANSPYGLETETSPVIDGLVDVAVELSAYMAALSNPAKKLHQILNARLDDDAEDLDSASRQRIEAMCRSLDRRILVQCGAWGSMLDGLGQETPPEFVDFFSVERIEGRDFDIGMHRHWVDPTKPFMDSIASTAQGVLITSASLRDGTGDDERDWRTARARTGALHLSGEVRQSLVSSPFDYPTQTKVFVVGDVDKNNLDQLAAGYRELMLASGGGALGLFTSIARLRGVHQRLSAAESFAHMTLLAQHVDPLDTGTLVDIFRAEEHACLLGTDAVRDGVDVPGQSLRLIIYDRVPWPRPTILHRRRKAAFEGRGFDDMITRLRLKQAYGRLVRRADDHGVFVMMDRAMPSRLKGAFPEGVEVRRLGLAEIIAETREFLETK